MQHTWGCWRGDLRAWDHKNVDMCYGVHTNCGTFLSSHDQRWWATCRAHLLAQCSLPTIAALWVQLQICIHTHHQKTHHMRLHSLSLSLSLSHSLSHSLMALLSPPKDQRCFWETQLHYQWGLSLRLSQQFLTDLKIKSKEDRCRVLKNNGRVVLFYPP
jgi:hypothetical protein